MSGPRPSIWVGAALQALGPLFSFATVFVVASGGGVQAQGQFAQSKAWVDLLVVLGTFGFPQGIVYVVNRLGASARRLSGLSLVYALVLLPVAWLCTALGAHRQWTGPLGGASDVACLAVAAASLVLHGLWRGVCLTRDQGAVFALLTVMPAAALWLAVVWQEGQGPMAVALMASGLASVAVGAWVVAAQFRGTQELVRPMPWRALWAHGSHVFVQAVLMALQPLLAYALVRHAGGGDAGVGLLHVGLFLVQGFVVPVSLVSPLLFARWTERHDESLLRRLALNARRFALVGCAGGAGLAALVAWAINVWGGESYQVAAAPAAVLMLTLPLAAWTRLVAPALHAHGAPQSNTAAAMGRLLVLALAGVLLVQRTTQAHLAVAWAWTLAEVAAWAWTCRSLRGQARPVSVAAGPEGAP